MKNNGVIQSQKQAPQPMRQHKNLAVFIGNWITEGFTIKAAGLPSVKILACDVYTWMPDGFFVLHTAYGLIGKMNVGGTEILGYDRINKKYFSRFYDSRGNVNESVLTRDGDSWTWRGQTTGCTSVFTENGTIQTAHHVRLDENHDWVPAMEVVLTKCSFNELKVG